MGLIEFGDIGLADPMKRRGRQDQDGGVDGQRETQRDRGVDGRERDRLALFLDALAIIAGLHQPRMQIEIMRHDGGPENAERQIKHFAIGQNIGGRRKPAQHRAPIGIGHCDLHRKADRDHPQHGHDKCFDPAKAEGLQRQDQEHVGRCDDHPDLERNVKQQIEADSGADHFGQVGGGDGDLRRHP